MKLSNKQFFEKMAKRRPVRKVNSAVIGDTTYDLMSDGSIRNPAKVLKRLKRASS